MGNLQKLQFDNYEKATWILKWCVFEQLSKKHVSVPPGLILNNHISLFPRSQTPPTVRRRGEGFGTLPKDVRLNIVPAPQSPGSASSKSPTRTPSPGPSQTSTMPRNRKNKGFMSFGKGFFKLGRGRWSSSAPNLGDSFCFCFVFCLRAACSMMACLHDESIPRLEERAARKSFEHGVTKIRNGFQKLLTSKSSNA